MDERQRTQTSKRLSLVLRHAPERVGLVLDAHGWTDVSTVLERLGLTREDLLEVVRTSPKQRFELDEVRARIRASQGHSVEVDLGYEAAEPPDVLFHGTVAAVLPAIRKEGLRRMQRHHVHLSADEATARIVGGRRGSAIVLRIRSRAMREAGYVFFVSANGVWLTESVPPSFIDTSTIPKPIV